MVCPPATISSTDDGSEVPQSGTSSLRTGLSDAELDATQVEAGQALTASQRELDALPDGSFLPIDTSYQNRAMLELLPVGQSFDPATTAAWLNTVEVSDEVDERYEYASPDGPDGAELGRGGMGRVLLVHDRHLGREVALKELLPEVVSSSGRRAAELRFVREARIAGQLEHPNIVTVYDMGRRPNGELYYSMKVVRGRTLSAALQSAGTLEERLHLFGHVSGLCQAIAYAHSEGVIHRDIKPDNVMIGEFGETVVLDWGGARVLPTTHNVGLLSSIPPQPAQRRWVGTPLYMSPEQIEGRLGDVDERSDVWALGVVLYQVLTGSFPFEGMTFTELGNDISEKEPKRVRDVQPEVAPELAAIAERALRKDRRQRYPSAREMMRDIEAYRSGAQVAAYSYGRWELGSRFVGRHRLAFGAALLGAAILAAVVARSYHRAAEASADELDAADCAGAP